MSAPEPFDAEQWELVRLAPWTVAIGVTEADPGGLFHHQRELAALVREVHHAADDDLRPWLIARVAEDLAGAEYESDHQTPVEEAGKGDIHDGVIVRCRQLRTLLDSVAPDQADPFCAWLVELAQAVAEAAKEGGIFGLGGARVSQREAWMLEEIAAALRPST